MTFGQGTWDVGRWTLDIGFWTGDIERWTYLAHAIAKLGRVQLFDLLTFIGSWHFIVTIFGGLESGKAANGGDRWWPLCGSLYFHSIGFYVLNTQPEPEPGLPVVTYLFVYGMPPP